MSFTVYPALDIRNGRVVRLLQGDYARETQYGDDVLPRAQAFADAGAQWMHLVDLDAAKAGGYTLAAILGEIVRQTGLHVQTGGGVRSRDDVARILDAGATRVVVGSLAVRERDRHRLAAGIRRRPADHRAGYQARRARRLAIAGAWLDRSGRGHAGSIGRPLRAGRSATSAMHRHCPRRHAVRPEHGPVRTPAHAGAATAGAGLRRCAQSGRCGCRQGAGCAGIVLGKALLEGHLALKEALAC